MADSNKKIVAIALGIVAGVAGLGLLTWGVVHLINRHYPFTLSDPSAVIVGKAEKAGDYGIRLHNDSSVTWTIPENDPDTGDKGSIEFDYIPTWNGTDVSVGGQPIIRLFDDQAPDSDIYLYFNGQDKWEAHIAGETQLDVPQIMVKTVAYKSYHVRMARKMNQWTIVVDGVLQATHSMPPNRHAAKFVKIMTGSKPANFYNIEFTSNFV